MSKDINRLYLFRKKINQIKPEDRIKFNKFLTDFGNTECFQSFLLLCTGTLDKSQIDIRFQNILDEFVYQKNFWLKPP